MVSRLLSHNTFMQNTVEENTEIIPPLQSKTVKVVANVFLLKSCSVLLAVILHFTIDHFYGPEGVGAFGLYMSVITITGLLASFGFGNAALKLSGAVGSDQELASVQSAYNMMLRLTSVAAGVCAVFVLFSAQKMSEVFLDDPYKAPVFYCSALAILPFALLEVSSEMIRGRGKTNLYMIFKETGLWLAAAPVLIFLLVSQYGYLSPIVSHLVAVLMFSVVAILVVQELLKPAEEVEHPNSISISNLLKLSLPMLMSKGLLWAGFWIDILIAGVFMGGADIGIYLVLDRIAAFGKQVSYSINVYVAPRIAYHFQQKRLKHLEKLTKDSVRYSVWILAPIMIILAIVAKPVLG
ncbi:MAG: lipopolysaccharide biosynthesis protein, partial [Verrucomicrobiota bacterium]